MKKNLHTLRAIFSHLSKKYTKKRDGVGWALAAREQISKPLLFIRKTPTLLCQPIKRSILHEEHRTCICSPEYASPYAIGYTRVNTQHRYKHIHTPKSPTQKSGHESRFSRKARCAYGKALRIETTLWWKIASSNSGGDHITSLRCVCQTTSFAIQLPVHNPN